MSASPYISICIPTYNGEKYLVECLESCISQTYSNYEIVICDDGSKDGTPALLETFQKRSDRIKFYKNEKNLGLVGNWNRCIEKSSGEWIKFVFQDDHIAPDCLREFAAKITAQNMLIVSKRNFVLPADASEKDRHYYTHGVRTLENTGYYTSDQFSAAAISAIAVENICLNFIAEPSLSMFRKEVVAKLGGFDPEFRQICDLEFMQRIGTVYGLSYLPKQNCYFRIHSDSTTTRNLDTNHFHLRYIEPVLLAHKMLFTPVYEPFRNLLNFRQLYRLKTYFKVRTFEAHLNSLHNAANKELFDKVCDRHEAIRKAAEGSTVTRFKYFLLKQVRKRR
jgi:glycosyltransferase involved in cell wall biosynthesis